jgi:hypothetical protein
MARVTETEKPTTDVETAAEVTETTPAEVRYCLSGSGAVVTGKGKYAPGGDAKHKSAVTAAILAGGDEQELLAQLGSDRLREQAVKQVENARTRLATQGTPGTVEIKGEEYDARKVRGANGVVRYDGDKGWTEVALDSKIGATFKSTADREKELAKADADVEAAAQADAA